MAAAPPGGRAPVTGRRADRPMRDRTKAVS
jgi:hypothetical protein